MSYAANLGRDEIIRYLHAEGATDHEHAVGRAALQGQVDTARMIYELAGRPPLGDDLLGGPAYTLSAEGTAFAFQMGARAVDAEGRCLAPALSDLLAPRDLSRRDGVRGCPRRHDRNSARRNDAAAYVCRVR